MNFRYEVSFMISLLLISMVGLNYLYLLIVVFILMLKAFIINVTEPMKIDHVSADYTELYFC